MSVEFAEVHQTTLGSTNRAGLGVTDPLNVGHRDNVAEGIRGYNESLGHGLAARISRETGRGGAFLG